MQLLGRPGTGRVLWAREGSAWLRLPDGVVGLASPEAPLGPCWIQRVEPWPSLAEGDTVIVDAEGLRTGDGTLFLHHRNAVGWLGPLPDPDALSPAPARVLMSDALSSCRRSLLLDSPWRERVDPAVAAIGKLAPLDALRLVATALTGLGPGLTPAGDDTLSGILFAFRALDGPVVEPALVAVARSARTGELAAGMLGAAAAGYHIEAVHDLVLAGAARDNAAAAVAATALDRFGSSSGADVAYGLRMVFTHR